MSLFEDPLYEWRETYFVFFHSRNTPSGDELISVLHDLGRQVECANVVKRNDGSLESVTVYSPEDFAAMDITCMTGKDVVEQLPSLVAELRKNCQNQEEQAQIKQILDCDSRIDIFHFEHLESAVAHDDDLELMDPGGLLLIMDKIGALCQGIVVDPQSASLM